MDNSASYSVNEIENYDSHKDGLMNHAISTRLTAVAIKGKGKLIGGKDHFPFCIPILCYAPPCPCMGGPIVWIPSDSIFSKRPTGEKTSEGHDLLELSIEKRTAVIVEKSVRSSVDRIGAAQKMTSMKCGSKDPRTLAKGLSPADRLKAAFMFGYSIGTALDDAFDGGLSDKGADYIEDVVDWLDDLF